ncbi:DUF748 domain-containing protein [Flavobacterium sp. F-65]|uniref:DUF748 domain-containing protein n=1 Tax=Flavobacterium pisciphilum TaxID=2893755 RepID=A0ABS8MVN5_9FLAO|nr:DUF748 domain-containing protein [Flavobacterium sp. F-65]MCC9072849.1 DUF748 domain-containing protein [Flavobacterium sp. F-65]
MSLNKKITIGIFSFLTLLLLINSGLNFWVKKQLPKIIQDNNTTPYQITYEDIKIDLWSADIYASNIAINPKNAPKDSATKIGIYSKIKTVAITDFSIWNLIFNDVLHAKSITIDHARVILYKKDENAIDNSNSIRTQVIEPFQKIIVVSNIYLNKASLDIMSTQTNKPILYTRNIAIVLEEIIINETTLKQKIPFSFQKYALNCDSIYYKPNPFYTINASQITTNNHSLKIKNFSYIPLYTRHQFVQKIAKEKDIFTIKATDININSMDWGFKNNVFFFNANSIVFDDLNANIYRNKLPEDDVSKKPLYNTLLRKIPFPLKIDTLSIQNSKLVYEEEINFQKGPAILNFGRFNLNATNIQSGYGLKKAADLDIKINCLFMKNSPLKVHWTLNVLDKNDGFHIKGSISKFDVQAMYAFTKPYTNTSFKGTFDDYRFDITGNDKRATGNASLEYKDLKVTLYKKKNPEKEAKLKSSIANLILKKDSDNEAKKAKIELERIQEKSFYNFLWRSIAESLKKILI